MNPDLRRFSALRVARTALALAVVVSMAWPTPSATASQPCAGGLWNYFAGFNTRTLTTYGSKAYITTSAGGPERPPLVSGYTLPNTLADGHVRLGNPPATRPFISADAAVDLALQYAGELASDARDASVQYVLFTDQYRGVLSTDGSLLLEFEDVPGWVVRFRGVPQPIFGGLGATGGVQAQELNVVIDANTGQYLEMFKLPIGTPDELALDPFRCAHGWRMA